MNAHSSGGFEVSVIGRDPAPNAAHDAVFGKSAPIAAGGHCVAVQPAGREDR